MNNENVVLTRAKAVEILNGYKVKAEGRGREVLQLAIDAISACNNCLGAGKLTHQEIPRGPYTKKISISGRIVYLTECSVCKGSGKLWDVVCCSCNVKEPLPVKVKSFMHCQKCNEKFTRLGLIQ